MDRERNLAAFLAGNHPDVPRVMYHGTKYGNIDKFKGYRGSAGHFAFTPKEASGYAGGHDEVPHDDEYFHEEGPQVYPVHISAKNVFDARNPDHVKKIGVNPRGNWDYEDLEHSVSAMKKAGFDSYFDFEYGISQMQNDGSRKINEPTGIAVFHPHQIKSATGNRGTFDPSDPDITKGDGGEVDGITAYHGSPHEFERFDTSKIGTGEGAQAFGHGLYFAEAEPVAKEYRDKLAAQKTSVKQHVLQHAPEMEKIRLDSLLDIKNASQNLNNDPLAAAHEAQSKNTELQKFDAQKIAKIIESHRNEATGHMYEVHIDAHPDHFLDWDKPLSEQHPNVQKFLSKVFNPPKEDQSIGDWLKLRLGEGMAEYWSEDMHKAGIPGIKYLDAGSRGPTDQPTHNYVVFDHDRVNIKRRYAEGGEVEREGFGFGGDTEFAGSGPVRGATGSAAAIQEAPQKSYRDMPEDLQETQRDLSFRNEQIITGMKESNALDKQRGAEQMTAWANAGFPAGGPRSMRVGEETRPNQYQMADISSGSPITKSPQEIVASIVTDPNVGMGMPGRIGPEPTTPNIGMGMPGRIGPEPTTPNVGMGMPGRIGPEPTIPNVGMGMPGRTGPEPTTANIAMGMPGRISPPSTTPQQDTVVASTPSDAGQQNALTLPGQKLFTRQSGPPMPPIPDRDLGAGNIFDNVLKPFGLDTASWLDNKSSEYIKQGMLPSDAYTKASYDLNDLQKNLKNRSSDGRKMVLKLMPDGTYQYVWEEYNRGGVAKNRLLPHNSAIVEYALAKISAPPPALDPTLMVAKRGRPF